MLSYDILQYIFSYNKYTEVNLVFKSIYYQKKDIKLYIIRDKYLVEFKYNNKKYKIINIKINSLSDFINQFPNNESLKLNIHSECVKNSYYKEFKKFKYLKEIDLGVSYSERKGEGIEPEEYSDLKLTNKTIQYIYELNNLEYLNLRGQFGISNNGFLNIYKLSNLKYLDLSYLNLDINCLLNIRLKKLEYLNLTRNKLLNLNDLLKLISELPNIKYIDLSLCSGIYDESDFINLCMGKLEDNEIIKYTNHGQDVIGVDNYNIKDNIVGYIEYHNRKINILVDRTEDSLNYY